MIEQRQVFWAKRTPIALEGFDEPKTPLGFVRAALRLSSGAQRFPAAFQSKRAG